VAKPSWQWTENDLLKMKRNQTEESLNLEFKGSVSLGIDESKKSEISKDVSAFANSEGGDIVYGVSEVGKPPSRFGDIDSGIDASLITPEWLEQVINSRIHPRIEGIRIKPVALKKTRPGKYAYVVHIPVSYDAPHQASDKRYYKRFNFLSVPMEDYEVRDVRNRWVEPIIEVEVSGKRRTPPELWDNQGKAQLRLSIVLKNVGRRTAQQVYLECNLPSRYLVPGVVSIQGKREEIVISGEHYSQLRYPHRDESGPIPLFPGTDHEVLDGNKLFIHMRLTQVEARDSLAKFISWIVYADGAEPRSGQISVGELFRPWQ
jgi:hypothetical protein